LQRLQKSPHHRSMTMCPCEKSALDSTPIESKGWSAQHPSYFPFFIFPYLLDLASIQIWPNASTPRRSEREGGKGRCIHPKRLYNGHAPLQQSGSPLFYSLSSTGWSEVRNTQVSYKDYWNEKVYFFYFVFYLGKLMSTRKFSWLIFYLNKRMPKLRNLLTHLWSISKCAVYVHHIVVHPFVSVFTFFLFYLPYE
jgi:hypothetical protein